MLALAELRGQAATDDEPAARGIYQDILAQALEDAAVNPERTLLVQLPSAPKSRKEVERLLHPVDPVIANNEAQVDRTSFLRYVRVDLEKREVILVLDGTVTKCTEPPDDPILVDAALRHIEEYFNTVQWGQTLDSRYAKTSMFEALLYVLASPFATEHTKIKQRRYAVLDSRGPQFLYIFGPAQNGKSTFLRFALKLLTGQHTLPFSGNQFTKTKVLGASYLGTGFPLVFDDVDPYKKDKAFETVLKSYWEVWWREEYIFPQIILTSNSSTLREWAKSRVKRIDFDVHFASNERNKERLASIFSQDNHIFKWFSFHYIKQLLDSYSPGDDELEVARAAMKELYHFSGRPQPDFFPDKPIDQMYDPGRRAWHDLLNGLRKAKMVPERDRLLITFTEDMGSREIVEYAGHLPQNVKHLRKGNTLVIESPTSFKTWLEGDIPRRRNWLTSLLKK